jgi:hypothetical protein
MYQWLVFVHVLAALTFMLAHGASAAVAFRLKQEKEQARIQALLDASGTTLGVMGVSFLVLLAAGVAAGFIGDWWRFGWIWLSLGLFLGITVWMSIYSRPHYSPLRKAVGLPYMEGNKPMPAVARASDAEIAAIIEKTNPVLLAAISYGLMAVILWLMMFKPF